MPKSTHPLVQKLHAMVDDLSPMIDPEIYGGDNLGCATMRVTLHPNRERRSLVLTVGIEYTDADEEGPTPDDAAVHAAVFRDAP